MKIILIGIYLLFTASGLLFMKLGGDSLILKVKNGFEFKIGLLTLLGFIFYAISFLIWQRVLLTFDLSYIVPITTGIMYVVVLIMGVLVFKENIHFYNLVGIVLILLGIILITLQK